LKAASKLDHLAILDGIAYVDPQTEDSLIEVLAQKEDLSVETLTLYHFGRGPGFFIKLLNVLPSKMLKNVQSLDIAVHFMMDTAERLSLTQALCRVLKMCSPKLLISFDTNTWNSTDFTLICSSFIKSIEEASPSSTDSETFGVLKNLVSRGLKFIKSKKEKKNEERPTVNDYSNLRLEAREFTYRGIPEGHQAFLEMLHHYDRLEGLRIDLSSRDHEAFLTKFFETPRRNLRTLVIYHPKHYFSLNFLESLPGFSSSLETLCYELDHDRLAVEDNHIEKLFRMATLKNLKLNRVILKGKSDGYPPSNVENLQLTLDTVYSSQAVQMLIEACGNLERLSISFGDGFDINPIITSLTMYSGFSKLRELVIQGRFFENSVDALFNSLRSNNSLTCLGLGVTHFTEKSVKVLTGTLESNKTLEILEFKLGKFEEKFLVDIAKSLGHNNVMTSWKFDLPSDWNDEKQIGELREKFAQELTENHSLVELPQWLDAPDTSLHDVLARNRLHFQKSMRRLCYKLLQDNWKGGIVELNVFKSILQLAALVDR
jgi:hypothetical protein